MRQQLRIRSPGWATTCRSGGRTRYRFGLSFSQTLFSGGRVSGQTQAANANVRSADIGLTAARAQLLLDVTKAYYDAALGDRLVAIAQATLQAGRHHAEPVAAGSRGGQPVGVRPAPRPGHPRQPAAGRDPAAGGARPRPLRAQEPAQSAAGPAARAHHRAGGHRHGPDRAARRAGARPRRTRPPRPGPRCGRRARRSPRRRGCCAWRGPSAGPSWRSRRTTPSSGYPNDGSPFGTNYLSDWVVAVGLQIPLFTGGRIKGDVAVARAGLEQARLRLQQTRELAQLDARSTQLQLQSAVAAWEASAGTEEQADRAYPIAEVRYREGISTQTELNDITDSAGAGAGEPRPGGTRSPGGADAARPAAGAPARHHERPRLHGRRRRRCLHPAASDGTAQPHTLSRHRDRRPRAFSPARHRPEQAGHEVRPVSPRGRDRRPRPPGAVAAATTPPPPKPPRHR